MTRILLVEDDEVSQVVTSGMLERIGMHVDVAADGYEALAALDHQRYDLIIMDLQMPRLDGFQATIQIRRRETTRRTPIVALTTFTGEGDRERCLAVGMDDYLPKPVESGALHACVAKWLGRSIPRERPATVAPAPRRPSHQGLAGAPRLGPTVRPRPS